MTSFASFIGRCFPAFRRREASTGSRERGDVEASSAFSAASGAGSGQSGSFRSRALPSSAHSYVPPPSALTPEPKPGAFVTFCRRSVGIKTPVSNPQTLNILLGVNIAIGILCLGVAVVFCPPIAAMVPFLGMLSLPILIPVCVVGGLLFMNMLNQVVGVLFAKYWRTSIPFVPLVGLPQRTTVGRMFIAFILVTGALSVVRLPVSILQSRAYLQNTQG